MERARSWWLKLAPSVVEVEYIVRGHRVRLADANVDPESLESKSSVSTAGHESEENQRPSSALAACDELGSLAVQGGVSGTQEGNWIPRLSLDFNDTSGCNGTHAVADPGRPSWCPADGTKLVL